MALLESILCIVAGRLNDITANIVQTLSLRMKKENRREGDSQSDGVTETHFLLSLPYLILVRIMKQDALRHKVSHHGVAAQRRDVGANNGQHLRDERLHKATQPSVLSRQINQIK